MSSSISWTTTRHTTRLTRGSLLWPQPSAERVDIDENMSPDPNIADPQSNERPWPVRYGVAVSIIVVAALLRMALTSLVGPTELAFSIFLPAILFAAWFGGFRAGALSTVLSALAADYYFTQPVGSFRIHNRSDEASLLIFLVLGFGMAWLAHSQRRAVDRSVRAESAERNERQRFETTLASIGDAVIATDKEGRVTFVNQIAQSLLRAPESAVLGRHLGDVFRIVNELTRAKVESPVAKVLREGGGWWAWPTIPC